MGENKDTKKTRELTEAELEAVSGGMLTFCNSDFDDVLTTASGSNGHVK